MFSPSLIAMLFHSFPQDELDRRRLETGWVWEFKSARDEATILVRIRDALATIEWPRIPIVGRAAMPVKYDHWFHKNVRTDRVGDVTFFWGRVSANQLISFFSEFSNSGADQLYVDLGTTVRPAGSGSAFDAECATYLANTAPSPGSARVGVAIVDLGIASSRGPDTYGGRLRHVTTNNMVLSDHAEKVLAVLLDRLDSHSMLPHVTVNCSLVAPPAHALVATGKGCFEQSNVVEMLDAVKALAPRLTNDGLPAAVNISLGTHVGPHNGESPFEEYIRTKLVQPTQQFVVAAAGNDGGKGLAAKRMLEANQREYLTLRTGPRCKDLLVEFWWDDSISPNVAVTADVYEPLAAGGRAHHGTVQIGAGFSGTSKLNATAAGLPPKMTTHSLFHAKCQGNLSCIAFALTSRQTALPVLEIKFGLESAAAVIVNGWIVISENDPQTAFIETGPEGTISVPASDPAILSVAGLDSPGQVWEGSSRGPAAQYQLNQASDASPTMAHIATLAGTTELGTSFASPRACADVAQVLSNPQAANTCLDAIDLMMETYGVAAAPPPWNARSGYHKAQ